MEKPLDAIREQEEQFRKSGSTSFSQFASPQTTRYFFFEELGTKNII
jgi:hypothetical protein